ncbi:MAG: hypothetical protein IH608_00610, partial [Proteobacteria bacterium]|nr:hypothetical protein [Pseudomonadota bacterium]
LAVLAAGLAGISALVHYFLGFPVWVYVLAGGLALVYFFLFLARMRKVAADAGGSDDAPDPES